MASVKGPSVTTGLPVAKENPRAHRGRMQSVERDQHAGFFERLVVFHHRLDPFGVELDVRRRGLIAQGDHQHHEAHGGVSFVSLSLPGAKRARK